MALCLLTRGCCGDESRNGLDALHHVLVAVGPLAAVAFDGLHQAHLLPRVVLVTLDHLPTLSFYDRFLLLHLLFAKLTIAESGTGSAGKNKRELA